MSPLTCDSVGGTDRTVAYVWQSPLVTGSDSIMPVRLRFVALVEVLLDETMASLSSTTGLLRLGSTGTGGGNPCGQALTSTAALRTWALFNAPCRARRRSRRGLSAVESM